MKLALRIISVFLVSQTSFAEIQRYASGRLYDFEAAQPKSRAFVDEETASKEFLKANIPLPSGCELELDQRQVGATHIHRTYELFCAGRKVLDHSVKLHYRRDGWIEYATSLIKKDFSVPKRTVSTQHVENYVANFKKEKTKGRAFDGRTAVEKVWWLGKENDELVPAAVLELDSYRPSQFKTVILDERNGEVIENRRVVRHVVQGRAWLSHPDNAAPALVDLEGIDANPTKLNSSYLYVMREENIASPTLQDVDPASILSPTEPDADTPANYATACTGNACKEHRFNAVNVYYHVNNYRNTLQGYFADLGYDSPTEADEPLLAVVNNFSVDFDGDGSGDETNNAAYVPRPCASREGRAVGDKCLSFVRPTQVTSANCGGTKTLLNLAREAVVVVHEYQHFLIDSIIVLVSGTYTNPTVGDALHEGYADYFGASHVSEEAGQDVTVVGEYAFQNCTYYSRDLSTIRPLTNEADDADPHVSGLSWASGLWALREELGKEITDMIALKSIFFLSRNPGFLESVEALVKADKSIYNGAHVTRIREIFYGDVKFTGGSSDIFRDIGSGVVEVGFRSCSAVHADFRSADFFALAGVFLAWLASVVLIARRRSLS